MRLIELEPGQRTMPTAVFYAADGGLHEQPQCEFGRAAVSAYVDGIDGRLMRSMKSILGSSLIEQTHRHRRRPRRPLPRRRRHLPGAPEATGRGRGRLRDRPGGARPAGVLRRRRSGARRPGRAGAAQRPRSAPAFARSSSSTSRSPPPSTTSRRCAARRRCWSPTSAAAPPTSRSSGSGPAAPRQAERKADILANHGVHVAGTDFDRRVELASVLPLLGYRAFGVASADQPAREVPSAVYFDLATWHLINTVYNPLRVAELRGMRSFYADPAHHRRLMSVVDQRLGHDLLARAEAAKITVAEGGATTIELDPVEAGLGASFDEAGRPRRARRRSRPDRRRRARDRGPGRARRRRDRCALLHRRLHRPAPADRAAAAGVSGGAAGARRSLRQRRQRAGAACGTALRQVLRGGVTRRAQRRVSRRPGSFARSG